MQSAKKNKRLLVICPHPVGYVPGQRLKFEQYFDAWRQNGYDIDIAPFMSESLQKIVYKKGFVIQKLLMTLGGYLRRFRLLLTLSNYDVVYLFLWATPFGPPLFERMVRKLSKKIVYDIDDLVYKGDTSPHNRLIGFLKSGSKVGYLMKSADHVLVSTDKLFKYASQFTDCITMIPATIDVNKYGVATKQPGLLTIGWSGSHTTSKYLHLLDNVLKQISAKFNIRIAVMGDPEFEIPGLDIDLIKWTAETEIPNLLSFDIGLHPLPDEEWVYGKSGGKLVQYMAAGIPIIASAIGPNYKAITEGYNGFLVTTEQEWIDKLSLLITDHELRRAMGKNARQFAVENYSVEANLHKYLEAIK